MKNEELNNLLKLWNDAGEDDVWIAGKGSVWSNDGDSVALVDNNAAHLASSYDRAKFIAASRKAVPELINHIKELKSLIIDLVNWLESPIVQGCFTNSAIRYGNVNEEVSNAAQVLWDRARSVVKETK